MSKYKKEAKPTPKLRAPTSGPLDGFPRVVGITLEISTLDYEVDNFIYELHEAPNYKLNPVVIDWKDIKDGKYTIQQFKNILLLTGLEGPEKKTGKENYIRYFRENREDIDRLLK